MFAARSRIAHQREVAALRAHLAFAAFGRGFGPTLGLGKMIGRDACHKTAIVTLIERPQLGDAEANRMHPLISAGKVAAPKTCAS